jgi:cytochrome c2
MWNKAPAMLRVMLSQGIAVPQVDAGEMADIIAYLSSVQYFQPPGYAAAGRALLENKGCLGCHMLGGRGMKGGVDLAKVAGLDSRAAVIAALWNHGTAVPATAAGVARWPALTPREAAHITAFLIDRGVAR